MNTANLQHRGLLLVLAELIELLKRKNLVTDEEMRDVLHRAEVMSQADQARSGLSDSNLEAITFPMRFLRNSASGPQSRGFGQVAADVGRSKDRTAAGPG